MKFTAWFEIIIRDRESNVKSRIRGKSKSFVKQWNELLYLHQSGVANQSIVDTGGTTRSVAANNNDFDMVAGAGVITQGIIFGSGNTAVAIDDHALETPIAHGTGAGQLSYLSCSVGSASVAGSDCNFTVSRQANNGSGGDVTVREVGIYLSMGGSYYGMALREVLGSPEVIADGDNIVVNYTIQVSI